MDGLGIGDRRLGIHICFDPVHAGDTARLVAYQTAESGEKLGFGGLGYGGTGSGSFHIAMGLMPESVRVSYFLTTGDPLPAASPQHMCWPKLEISVLLDEIHDRKSIVFGS